MARQVITYSTQKDALQELVACDPKGLETVTIPIQANQGLLLAGTFIDIDGNRATIATQVEGVLASWLDTDDHAVTAPYTQANGILTCYSNGRFLWPAVRKANPSFVFDPTAISTLRAEGLTFEPVFAGAGKRWIREP